MAAVPEPESEFPDGWYDADDEWAYLRLVERREHTLTSLIGRFLLVALLLPVVFGLLALFLILVF